MSQDAKQPVTPQRKGGFLKPKPAVRDSAVTILTAGCHFNGKLYCRGSSRIGGRVEGTIISEGLLVIESEALIEADVIAEDVIIQGTVTGRVEAKNRLELTPSSVFEGELVTPSLVIHEGARFNGSASMVVAAEQEIMKPKLMDTSVRGAASA